MTTTEEPRKFKRPLPVDLTDDEKVKKGHRAGMLKKAIAKVKAAMKLATSEHKDELKQHEANLNGILDDLETGTEIRQVECFEKKDFTKKKVEIIRADTGKVEETRTMSPFELQEKIPGTNGAAKEDEDDDEEGPDLNAPPPPVKRGRGRPRKEARA